MKSLFLCICVCLAAAPRLVLADDVALGSASRGVVVAAPVTLRISSDLVKGFPIDVSATTTESEMRFTLGPKADGQYCTLEAQIVRIDKQKAKITVSFAEETKVAQADGGFQTRNVGFTALSTVLSVGEETVLFSSGEAKFTLGMPKAANTKL